MLNTAQHLAEDIFSSNIKKLSTREGAGQALAKFGDKDKNIVVLCADLTESTKVEYFAHKFPERFIQTGIAEQNMASIAAGLAIAGKTPVIASYACFSPTGNYSQLRLSVAYNNANVKVLSTHAGLTVGPDGATHQAFEDIALVRTLPNFKLVVPSDSLEAEKALDTILQNKGPYYIRLTREPSPQMTTIKTPFKEGKAQVWVEGTDITLVSCGPIIYQAFQAVKSLRNKHNISVELINSPWIKPLDKETILKSAKKTNKVITLEDHNIIGGLGSAVAEAISETHPTILKRLGIKDTFGESGKYEELLEKFGLDAHNIEKEVLSFLKT